MVFLKEDYNISLIPFTAFDFETTGLDSSKDKIVEIGAVKFQNSITYSTMEMLVNPGMPMPIEASRVNGITDEMLAGKRPAEKIIPDFLSYIKNSVIIAHNAPFDLGFLNAAINTYKLVPLNNPVIDTLLYAKKLLPSLPSHSLQNLAIRFNIDPGSAHRATDDARVCKEIFLKLLELIPGGLTMSLEKLLEMVPRPRVDKKKI